MEGNKNHLVLPAPASNLKRYCIIKPMERYKCLDFHVREQLNRNSLVVTAAVPLRPNKQKSSVHHLLSSKY